MPVIAAARPVVGADGAVGRGAADRPVLLRGIFAVEGSTARRARLTELARIDATLVMFESGNRVQDTLADLADDHGRRATPRSAAN